MNKKKQSVLLPESLTLQFLTNTEGFIRNLMRLLPLQMDGDAAWACSEGCDQVEQAVLVQIREIDRSR